MEKLVFLLPSGNICQIEHKPGTIWSYDQMQKATEIFRDRTAVEERRKALDAIQYAQKVVPRILLSVSVFNSNGEKIGRSVSTMSGQDWKEIASQVNNLPPDEYSSQDVKHATEEQAAAYVFGY